MNTNVMEGINEAPTSMLLLLLFCFVFLPFILIFSSIYTANSFKYKRNRPYAKSNNEYLCLLNGI